MRISRSRRWLAGIVLLLALLFAAFLWLRPLLNIGAGYAAKHACSCHFLQGRALDEIREHDLNFSVLGYVSLTKAENEVRSSFFGLVPRTARYRAGVGCTLINDVDRPLAEIAAAVVAERSRSTGAGRRTEQQATNPSAYAEAVDFGIAPRPGGGGRALVVMKNGAVVAEGYADGFDVNSLLLGWSMTKTLTGLALGPALDPGGKTPPAELGAETGLFPEFWTDSARRQIPVESLLAMNSGLAWNENYGSISDATIMLHERADMAAYAYRMPAAAAPGTTWSYSSGTTNVIAALIDRRVAMSSAHEFMHELFRPVAPSLTIEPDQSGIPVGSSYGWATARDWARLGQLMLQRGVWEGDTLVPPAWIDYLLEPAAGSDGIYGRQTWLIGPDTPSLPAGSFVMRGFQDQRVFVIPARGLVIARLAHEEDQTMDFDGLIQRVLAADEALSTR